MACRKYCLTGAARNARVGAATLPTAARDSQDSHEHLTIASSAADAALLRQTGTSTLNLNLR